VNNYLNTFENITQSVEQLLKYEHNSLEIKQEAMAKAIAFYNDFLEQQERYQQETPEQREAEKVWIYQQRQELAQMQDGIEVILNAG
jgi:oligoendopeptidase F